MLVTNTSNVSVLFHQKSLCGVSKYEFFSGPDTVKYGPEKPPYLDTFHPVNSLITA